MAELDLDEAKYALSQAALATGWNTTTLRDYLAKGVFPWREGDVPAKVQGGKAVIPLRSVLRLAIAYQFWSLGISPKDAFLAALAFCDDGTPENASQGTPYRAPGTLFSGDVTTLLVWKRGHNGEVVPLQNGKISDVAELTSDPFNGAPGAVAVANVSEVWSHIARALKIEA